MAPREIIIGAAVVCTQLLYSAVYPHFEQHISFVAQFAATAEAWLNGEIAPSDASQLQYTAAVCVNTQSTTSYAENGPHSSVASSHAHKKERLKNDHQHRSVKQLSRAEMVERAVTDRMMPHMSFVSGALKSDSYDSAGGASGPGLKMSWDVHRITDAQLPWAYLFRVTVANLSPNPCSLQGVARFYVLRAPDGSVFPIHRVTEGPASFIVDSGEKYQYAWIFFTKHETVAASGGLLLENKTAEGDDVMGRFLNATLTPLKPAKAQRVTSEMVHTLMQAYSFMGAIDLRGANYV